MFKAFVDAMIEVAHMFDMLAYYGIAKLYFAERKYMQRVYAK